MRLLLSSQGKCRYAETRALLQRGARVLFTSRSLQRAENAAKRLRHEVAAVGCIALRICINECIMFASVGTLKSVHMISSSRFAQAPLALRRPVYALRIINTRPNEEQIIISGWRGNHERNARI